MSVEFETKVDVDVTCKECGEDLDGDGGESRFGTYIEVERCQKCFDKKFEEGKEAGLEDGEQIGYDKGYEEGFEEGKQEGDDSVIQ